MQPQSKSMLHAQRSASTKISWRRSISSEAHSRLGHLDLENQRSSHYIDTFHQPAQTHTSNTSTWKINVPLNTYQRLSSDGTISHVEHFDLGYQRSPEYVSRFRHNSQLPIRQHFSNNPITHHFSPAASSRILVTSSGIVTIAQ